MSGDAHTTAGPSTRDSSGSKAPAIARAAAILRLLGKRGEPMGVQAIARELGLVPSTCLYALRALTEEQLVAFDANAKRYSLDAGVLTLARQWLARDRFHELAQPVLDGLARTFGVTAIGAQLSGLDHIIVTAMSRPGEAFQLSTQIGSRFPALVSATGRCIAAFGGWPDAKLRPLFDALRWDDPPSWETWKAQVAQARETGVALDEGHFLAGATVVAAPVWRGVGGAGLGRPPSHVLVALGFGGKMRDALEPLKETLRQEAGLLGERLSA